ncbi:universal stress protein [Nocardia bovistercoris]|uniref:Universal stress protein n=1 Tax=Nocardia bovistercoris TaxID=2785916 RepID=A0A931IK13_9NOCA|nr:universal stress protein [Nocardia bovistercoris]MBH0781075.1 universal stress protein [Nocardia bovistercoris]
MADYSAQAPGSPVVVAVDGSASAYQAAAWAAATAVAHRWPLHILVSMGLPEGYGPGLTLSENDIEYMNRDGARIVTEAARIARVAVPGEELRISTEVAFEEVRPMLVERSRSAAMMVVGRRGIGAFRRGLLGSVSTAVTRHAHCPVAVVHDIAGLTEDWKTRPVLVGVDGSENSRPAIELAFAEASLRKVGLIALHTWSDSTGLAVPLPGWDAVRESEHVLLAEQLAGYRERYPDVTVRRIVVCDRPARALLEESADAQLLVVGSRGRGGFATMTLGSTSNSLLHSVKCPMIVVRSEVAP